MVDVISIRKKEMEEARQDFLVAIAEVSVKSVGGFLSGLGQTKQAGKNIASAANRLNFRKMFKRDKPRAKELPTVSKVMAAFGIGADGLGGKR